VAKSDYAGSTSYSIRMIEEAPSGSKWAIGTEMNLVQRLIQAHPDKEIISLNPHLCPCMTMNRIDLAHLLWSIESIETEEYKHVIKVENKTAEYAKLALDRMLEHIYHEKASTCKWTMCLLFRHMSCKVQSIYLCASLHLFDTLMHSTRLLHLIHTSIQYTHLFSFVIED